MAWRTALRRFFDEHAFRIAIVFLLVAMVLRFAELLLCDPSVREFHLPDGTRCVIVADGRALACEWKVAR